MSRPPTRWPIWKISLTTACGAAVTATLFILSRVTETAATSQPADSASQGAALTLPGMLMMLGVLGVVLTLLAAVWLGVRVREALVPAWKRHPRTRRR